MWGIVMSIRSLPPHEARILNLVKEINLWLHVIRSLKAQGDYETPKIYVRNLIKLRVKLIMAVRLRDLDKTKEYDTLKNNAA